MAKIVAHLGSQDEQSFAKLKQPLSSGLQFAFKFKKPLGMGEIPSAQQPDAFCPGVSVQTFYIHLVACGSAWPLFFPC
ncbi:MAG: hypothetical protein B1H40_01770 [Candidatus Latescibacteria bacterium 4484_181]|nr:MAG: hypothetical protein B1H40_01770 [Candidatus Latescibacteria bacterium 4484_181]